MAQAPMQSSPDTPKQQHAEHAGLDIGLVEFRRSLDNDNKDGTWRPAWLCVHRWHNYGIHTLCLLEDVSASQMLTHHIQHRAAGRCPSIKAGPNDAHIEACSGTSHPGNSNCGSLRSERKGCVCVHPSNTGHGWLHIFIQQCRGDGEDVWGSIQRNSSYAPRIS